jgi:hypothetical protein
MKLYAYCRDENGKDQLVHVWDAQKARIASDKAPRRYYSTQLDRSRRREMVLVRRGERLFFRYKQLSQAVSAGAAQSLTHILAKEYLAAREQVDLRLPQGELTLFIKDWEAEKRLETGNGQIWIADLAAEISASDPPEVAALWEGRLLVEITVTHESKGQKLRALGRAGWPVMEIVLGPALRIPEGGDVTPSQIERAKGRLEQYLAGPIPARVLVDPSEAEPTGEGLWLRIWRFIDDIITN